MASLSLQFKGVQDAGLLALLGLAIALALLAYGLWQLAGRRRRGLGLAGVVGGVLAGLGVLLAGRYVPMKGTGGQLVWLVLLAAVVATAVGVFYSAVYAYLGRRRIGVLLALRSAGIVALLLILFKPALSYQPSGFSTKPVLPVLVDRSASMGTIDHPDLPSRYRQATEALSAQRRRLVKHFRVRWIHFATAAQDVEGLEDLGDLSPSGEGTDGTDLAAALRQGSAGLGTDELAGVVLISDGIHNAEADVLDAARQSRVPIYAIGVGSPNEAFSGRRNLQLLGVDAPYQVVRNNVAELTAKVRLTGWANIPAKVVLAEGGKELDSQQVLSEANAKTLTVRLKWTPGEPQRPTAPDIRTLRIAVQPNPAETNADDNAAELHVLVTRPSIRVLYVEGTLRPEYKPLRRVLASDPNVKLISLVRMEGNRFLVQGSIDGRQLTDLPRTDEEFGLFDVLIIGDLDRTFLKRQQMEKIRQFVNDGKALLMLGGRNSFGPGGYGGTPVEEALPVICGPRSQPQETTRFVPQLTAAGLASPIFEGLAEFFHTPARRALKPLPKLLGCVTVVRARPGAQVLAIHPSRRNAAGPLVVLAVHNFGAGRAAAFSADTTWLWSLRLRSMGVESPYHRFWGQLIRYLAGVEKKDQRKAPCVLGRIERSYLRQGEELAVAALVRGADGQPADDAAVTVLLSGGGLEKPLEVALRRSPAGAGLYEGRLRPSRPGKFTVGFRAADRAGKALGSDELGVIVAPRSKEAERLARDAKTLRAVARLSGGRYAELAALPDVIDELIQRSREHLLPAVPSRQYNLYNFVLLFLLFVALLTTEWLLRRSWQLQ